MRLHHSCSLFLSIFLLGCSTIDRVRVATAFAVVKLVPTTMSMQLSYEHSRNASAVWLQIYRPILASCMRDQRARLDTLTDMKEYAEQQGDMTALGIIESLLQDPSTKVPETFGEFISSYLAGSVEGRGELLVDLRSQPGRETINVHYIRLSYVDYRRTNGNESGKPVGRQFVAWAGSPKEESPSLCRLPILDLLQGDTFPVLLEGFQHRYQGPNEKREDPPTACSETIPIKVSLTRIQMSSLHGMMLSGKVFTKDGVILATFEATERVLSEVQGK